jgi:hypothetical protein
MTTSKPPEGWFLALIRVALIAGFVAFGAVALWASVGALRLSSFRAGNGAPNSTRATPAPPTAPLAPALGFDPKQSDAERKDRIKLETDLVSHYSQEVAGYSSELTSYKDHLAAWRVYVSALDTQQANDTAAYRLVIHDTIEPFVVKVLEAFIAYAITSFGAQLIFARMVSRTDKELSPLRLFT